jgi:hypothetical protein
LYFADTLGNVINAELGVWDEYYHTLLVTKFFTYLKQLLITFNIANITGAQAAPARSIKQRR